jgi:Putative zinc-finger
MRCEEIRPLLPELAEGNLREAGEVERHLASCAGCSADLGRYRTLLMEMSSLREVVAEPRPEFLQRVLSSIPGRGWWTKLHRVASDERVHVAAVSVGGAVLGAAAVGLLWWRSARRPLASANLPITTA